MYYLRINEQEAGKILWIFSFDPVPILIYDLTAVIKLLIDDCCFFIQLPVTPLNDVESDR